jgi:hypothetical protein
MENIENKPKVRMDELGLYLRTIDAEYKLKTNQERADLITQFFNVICLVEDIEHYEALWDKYNQERSEGEDWCKQIDYELESRRSDYFAKIGKENPFN